MWQQGASDSHSCGVFLTSGSGRGLSPFIVLERIIVKSLRRVSSVGTGWAKLMEENQRALTDLPVCFTRVPRERKETRDPR